MQVKEAAADVVEVVVDRDVESELEVLLAGETTADEEGMTPLLEGDADENEDEANVADVFPGETGEDESGIVLLERSTDEDETRGVANWVLDIVVANAKTVLVEGKVDKDEADMAEFTPLDSPDEN